jgi:hypothetical protein
MADDAAGSLLSSVTTIKLDIHLHWEYKEPNPSTKQNSQELFYHHQS